MMTMIGNGAVQ